MAGEAGERTSEVGSDDVFAVDYHYRLRFTRDVFQTDNATFLRTFPPLREHPHRVLVCIDSNVAAAWPQLGPQLDSYFAAHRNCIERRGELHIVPGGETAKNSPDAYEAALCAINNAGICRRSFVLAIGGGAMLDVVGYAAATAHRGVRLIRMPTTTLAQADAGIGVKNGINAFGKKNFIGSFAVPWAVINDASFLTTLSDRDWRCGLSEAVKVALVKDAAFFEQIEAVAPALASRDAAACEQVVKRCAELHLRHIVDGGDPFELTEARPLDFGHWAAHKLEQRTDWRVRHGEAVAIGIALDVTYAALIGMLREDDAQRIMTCLESLGFVLFDETLNDHESLLLGLEEFREHLGGRLTVQLLDRIGHGVDVNDIDHAQMILAIDRLRQRAESLR